jgi:outer membrane receptor for ferrienterochelin and colicin
VPLHLWICLSLALVVQSADARLTGVVVTGMPPRPVAGARVTAGAATATTDADGAFTIVIAEPSGAAHITVSARGYVDTTVDLTAESTRAPVTITLVPNPAYQDEVTVVAPAAEPTAPPTMIVAPTTVTTVAGALDNVFRVLQTMPGVTGTDDFGSRLSVRGGGPDENLTVMDGVEIHDPYRLFGLTSAFNPETIERFELTAGGFGAAHGDRLSSILLVDNREGTTSKPFAASGALSITDANVVTEGRLPSGSWLLTARRTYYDLIASHVADTDLPSFNDLQTKVAWKLPGQRQLTFFGLRSRESTNASFDKLAHDDTFSLRDNSDNDVAALTFRTPVGSRATSTTIAAWYRYSDALGADAAIQTSSTRSNAPGDEALARAVLGFSRGLGLRDGSVREELTFAATRRHTFNAGVEAHALRTSWTSTIAGDRNPSAANGSSLQGGTALPDRVDSTAPSARAGAWLEDAITLNPALQFVAGVRLDRSQLTNETTLSPRARMTWALTPATTIRLATGRYTQSPGYEKLFQGDYFVDLSTADNLRLLSERSTHMIAGLEHTLSPAVSARVEAYYKRFTRMIAGRLETPAEAAARVAQYAFPSDVASSVPTEPTITTIPDNSSSGRAYGVDFYLEKRPSSSLDRLTGWISYTLGTARLQNYGITFPFDYDRRHSLSVVSTLRLTASWSLGTTVRAASGFPFTLPVGLRVASTLAPGAVSGDPGSLVPRRDPNGLYMWTVDYGGVDNLNRGRLPAYVRVDLRFTYERRASRWQLYFEVLNAHNRDNAGSYTPRLEYAAGSDRPNLTLKPDGGLPLLPTLGLRVKF